MKKCTLKSHPPTFEVKLLSHESRKGDIFVTSYRYFLFRVKIENISKGSDL